MYTYKITKKNYSMQLSGEVKILPQNAP